MTFIRILTASGLLALISFSAAAHIEPDLVDDAALLEDPEIVDCTLENGDAAKCAKFSLKFLPDDLAIGPFCPATLDEVGGIWDWTGEEPGVYRIDREFLTFLADQGYKMYDDDENVFIDDLSGGQPEVDHACLAANQAPTVTMEALIPVDPVMAETPTDLGTVAKVGLALDGVPIFADAPTVQSTGHMPALDVCGGHVDPGGWYHWHATSTDIEKVLDGASVEADCGVAQDSSALFGYAFDGLAMYGSTEADGSAPEGLDDCGGHMGTTPDSTEEVYHYHASDSFPNLPPCLVGVVATDNFSTTATQGIGSARAEGGRGPGGGDMPPGFEEAAEALGVEPEALMQAIDEAGGPRADLAEVAKALGVSEEDLGAALPPPQ